MAGRKRSVLVATGAHGELAEALRRLRDQRGMTLRQVAARSGYSLATLSMAESGRRFPSWEVLAAFVQSCGADPGEWRPLWLSAVQSEARADEAAAHTAQAEAGPPAQAEAAPGAHRPHGPRWLPGTAQSRTAAALAAFMAITAAAVWATISHLAAPSPGTHPPAASPSRSRPAALAKAVVAPQSCGALRFGADGTAEPVTCPDGRPNLAADRYYRQMHLRVLALGQYATPVQVGAAICADMATGKTTFPIEARAVDLAYAEQGWHFGLDPASDVGPGLCPTTR